MYKVTTLVAFTYQCQLFGWTLITNDKLIPHLGEEGGRGGGGGALNGEEEEGA